ncbi:MAG: hypothetical protein ACK415_06220 [Thermodesulfovibrionales bacterium]
MYAQADLKVLEREYYELDYRIREWDRIRQQSGKVVIPENFENDLARWNQLSAQLAVARAKQSADVGAEENTKNVLVELIKHDKTTKYALDAIDKTIETLKAEQEFYKNWEREASLDTGIASTLYGQDRERFQHLKDEAVRRQRELREQIESLEQKQNHLNNFKSSVKGILSAKEIYGAYEEGDFFSAAEKTIDMGSDIAEKVYDKKTFEEVSGRLESAKGFLDVGNKIYQGNYLDASITAGKTIDSLLADYQKEYDRENKTLQLFMESDFVDKSLKDKALQVIDISNERKSKIEHLVDFKKKVKYVNERLGKFKKYYGYYKILTGQITEYERIASMPGRSENTARLIFGMSKLGDAFNMIADAMPPGLRETLGEFLSFYAEALKLGESIDKIAREWFEKREACLNIYGQNIHNSYALKVIEERWGRDDLCIRPAPEFKQSGLAMYFDDNIGKTHHPIRYFFMPNLSSEPIGLTQEQYSKIVKIASDYSAYASFVASSYRLTNEDLRDIITAIQTDRDSFTINDGYFRDTTFKISQLSKDVQALFHIKASLGDELTVSNHRSMIDYWYRFIDSTEFTERLCGFNLYANNNIIHRMFVNYLKNRDAFEDFIVRQKLTNPASHCKIEVSISGDQETVVNKPASAEATVKNARDALRYEWLNEADNSVLSSSNTVKVMAAQEGTYRLRFNLYVKSHKSEIRLFSLPYQVIVKPDPDTKECSYQYSQWDQCSAETRTQTRTVISRSPERCIEKTPPVLERPCVPPTKEPESCAYQYSQWSACDSNTKKQTRSVITKKPAGCVEKEIPILERSCTPDIEQTNWKFSGSIPSNWAVTYNDRGIVMKRQEAKIKGPCGQSSVNAELWVEFPASTNSSKLKSPEDCLTKAENDFKARRAGEIPNDMAVGLFMVGGIEGAKGFSLGDFKGAIADFALWMRRGSGSPWSGYTGSYFGSSGKGCAVKDNLIVNYKYTVSGGGCWDNSDRAYLVTQGVSAQAEARAILSSLQVGPDGVITQKPYEGPKYDGSDLPKVTLSPSKIDKLRVGDTVRVTAEVHNAKPEDSPFTYNWNGTFDEKPEDVKKKATVTIKPLKPGKYDLSVSIDGSRFNMGSASLQYEVVDLKVKISRVPSDKKPVILGVKTGFNATITEDGKPASGPFIYRWQPLTEVVFDKLDSETPNVNALFKKTGRQKVWVDVLERKGGREVSIAESEQLEVEVINPQLNLSFSPSSPYIGQEVKVEVLTNPKMGDDMVSFWWDIPGYFSGTGDKATFRPKDNKPIKVVAHAKAKDSGEEIGVKEVVITAQGYQVGISEPRYLQSPPQIWQCDTQLGQAQKCGMVTVKPNQFMVHRDIFFKATITPNPESPRYRWTVDPSGSCGFPGSGSEIKINCSNTGTYTVKVEVTNAEGIKLGEATQTVTISISQEQIDNSKKAKEAYEKLQKAKELVSQGRLDEAIGLSQEAVTLDPKNQEAKGLLEKWSKERDKINGHIKNLTEFIKGNRFPEAEKELKSAQSLHPKYPKVVEAEKDLKASKERHKREVIDRLNEAKRLAREGKIDEAVSIANEVSKIDNTSATPVKDEIAVIAKDNGWDALGKGDYKTAIKRLEQAVGLNPKDADAQKRLKDAKDYQAKMPQVEARLKEFEALIAEKKTFSSYNKLLEVQDILRTMALGQSTNNPVIIKMNTEYGKLNKWYNELVQKTNSEWAKLFQEREWEKAEQLFLEVLKYEHNESNKRSYESSLQMVKSNLQERKEAVRYYEQARENNTKGHPSEIKDIDEVIRELKNRQGKFKTTEQTYSQIQELIKEMEKRKKVLAAVGYAQNLFNGGDIYYRNHQYGLAAQQYEQGLKAIRESTDMTHPLYSKYYGLWEESIAKDKRFREIYNYVSTIANTEKRYTEEELNKAIALGEEGLKIVPNSDALGPVLYKVKWMLSELKRKKEMQAQCEAKWTEGLSLYNENRHKESLIKFRENLVCNPNNEDRQNFVVKLENTLRQADILWDECIKLVKANQLDKAVSRCEQSLSYWRSEERQKAYSQLKASVLKEEDLNKKMADKLWNECIELTNKKLYEQAWQRCDESLKYWKNDKRIEAVAKLKEAVRETNTSSIKTPPQTPTSTYIPNTETGTIEKRQRRFYQVDLRPYGGKKGIPRTIKDIEVDDSSWIRLKATDEKRLVLDIKLPQPVRGNAIAIVNNLDNAHYLPDGFTTTVMTVYTTDGNMSFEIKAGIHSSEWNRSETSGADHRWPRELYIGDKRWMPIFKVPEGSVITGIRFEHRDTDKKYYHAGSAPGFCLRGITIIGSGTVISDKEQSSHSNVISSKKSIVIFNNGNISSVYNSPKKATVFTINQHHVITLIQNYHWNNARGSMPGSIALRDQSGITYGPWQAKGSPGPGGVPNAYWTVYPNITLPAGTYTVIDSEPSTWAQNTGSDGAGHTRIEGYPAAVQQSSSIIPSSQSGGTIITAEFINNSRETVHIFVEGDSFGPYNRVAPNERKKSNIKVPDKVSDKGGFIKFIVVRNGQVLASCRWEYDPDTISRRIPVVKFMEPNIISCTTLLTQLEHFDIFKTSKIEDFLNATPLF